MTHVIDCCTLFIFRDVIPGTTVSQSKRECCRKMVKRHVRFDHIFNVDCDVSAEGTASVFGCPQQIFMESRRQV